MFESLMSMLTSIIIFIVVVISVVRWVGRSSHKPNMSTNIKVNRNGNAPFATENIVFTLFVLFFFGVLLCVGVTLLGNAANPKNGFGYTVSMVLGLASLAFALFIGWVFYNHTQNK